MHLPGVYIWCIWYVLGSRCVRLATTKSQSPQWWRRQTYSVLGWRCGELGLRCQWFACCMSSLLSNASHCLLILIICSGAFFDCNAWYSFVQEGGYSEAAYGSWSTPRWKPWYSQISLTTTETGPISLASLLYRLDPKAENFRYAQVERRSSIKRGRKRIRVPQPNWERGMKLPMIFSLILSSLLFHSPISVGPWPWRRLGSESTMFTCAVSLPKKLSAKIFFALRSVKLESHARVTSWIRMLQRSPWALFLCSCSGSVLVPIYSLMFLATKRRLPNRVY